MVASDSFRLDGRAALLTGSGRDIGRTVAEAFANAGGFTSGQVVHVNGRNAMY